MPQASRYGPVQSNYVQQASAAAGISILFIINEGRVVHSDRVFAHDGADGRPRRTSTRAHAQKADNNICTAECTDSRTRMRCAVPEMKKIAAPTVE
jgi:hypothetical protein